jgi:hypothetical protein
MLHHLTGAWKICSPMQTEVVRRPKFDLTESAFNASWKRLKDKKTVEEINLLMNDESCVKHQRPRDPNRLKNHLKQKGVDLVKHDKENTPAEAPPPVTDGKPPTHSPMEGKMVLTTQ